MKKFYVTGIWMTQPADAQWTWMSWEGYKVEDSGVGPTTGADFTHSDDTRITLLAEDDARDIEQKIIDSVMAKYSIANKHDVIILFR